MWPGSVAAVLACILVSVQCVAAADTTGANTTQAAADPLACGSLCIYKTTLASSTCSVTNATCLCTNEALLAEIEVCVSTSCTVKEQLAAKKYSTQTCGQKGRDQRTLVLTLGAVFGALAVLAFALRCFARLFTGTQKWGWDDWVMCLSMGFVIPESILSIALAKHGLGLDMWMVSFENITTVLYLYFWAEILYVVGLATTKVSIIFFYLIIFPKPAVKRAAKALGALSFSFGFGYCMAIIFRCRPVQGAWRTWPSGSGDAAHAARCSDISVLGWSGGGVNLALDLCILVLPLPELVRLQMSWRKKGQVLTMFALGFFTTVVSAVRLQSLISIGDTSNATQDYADIAYWSNMEVTVAAICACLPAIRQLFKHVFPHNNDNNKDNNVQSSDSNPDHPAQGPNKRRRHSRFIRVQHEVIQRSERGEEEHDGSGADEWH